MKLINLQKKIQEIVQTNPFALNAEVCVRVHDIGVVHTTGEIPTINVNTIDYDTNSKSVVLETDGPLRVI